MKTFKFNALFSAIFAIIRPVQFHMAALNYVPGTAEPSQFDDLPAGEYVVILTGSDEKYTQATPAQKFIALEHQIVEGQYKGRKLFNNLFYWSSNEVAARIAAGTVESICRAQGRQEAVSDTSELHNKTMLIKLAYNTMRKNSKTGQMEELQEGQRNSITSYKKYDGGSYAPVQATASYQAPVAQAAAPITAPPVAVAAAPDEAAKPAPWG